MLNTPLICCVDAGGTNTFCALFAGYSKVCQQDFASIKSFVNNPEEWGKKAFDYISKTCLSFGCTVADVSSIVVGMAGVWDYQETQPLQTSLSALVQAKVLVTSDAHLAFYAACKNNNGIIAIAGTGSIILNRQNSIMHRYGGLNLPFGDEGSGTQIAYKAMQHVALQLSQSTNTSVLTEKVLQGLPKDVQNASRSEIARYITTKARISVQNELPKNVISLYNSCNVSREILRESCGDLAALLLSSLNLQNASHNHITLFGSVATQPAYTLVLQEFLGSAIIATTSNTNALHGALYLAQNVVHH